jgi:hypothetical protein
MAASNLSMQQRSCERPDDVCDSPPSGLTKDPRSEGRMAASNFSTQSAPVSQSRPVSQSYHICLNNHAMNVQNAHLHYRTPNLERHDARSVCLSVGDGAGDTKADGIAEALPHVRHEPVQVQNSISGRSGSRRSGRHRRAGHRSRRVRRRAALAGMMALGIRWRVGAPRAIWRAWRPCRERLAAVSRTATSLTTKPW